MAMKDFRKTTYQFLNRVISAPEHELKHLLEQNLSADTVWHIAHPINELHGIDAVYEGFIQPLRQALSQVRRRDEIFIGGQNNRAEHGDWVAAVTHYVGNFKASFLGIAPSQHLAFLRAGEFYQLEAGRIKQAYILADFIDLMRQAGQFPLPFSLGTEMLYPGPATHDGVLPTDREASTRSLNIVEGMLGDLHTFDPESFSSSGQTGKAGYWHDDMLWYGPAGIGANYRWDGFVQDHRQAFLSAFPDRKGGNHYCRIGDGHYAAVSGWPSMTMTHQGDYLGVPASGKALTLRVMDFYRCTDQQIMENWVFLDYGDLFAQLERPLLYAS